MLYRQIAGDHNIKQVRTISSERSSTPTQLNYVNVEHNVRNMQHGKINDDSKNDYAELRTDDITYTVPEVRLSRASLSSFMSLKDMSEGDGEYHLPMYSSMSALNQHYAQPGATISTARSMESLSIPPINADDYMSMGSRFASFSHNYDRPTSSQSMDNSKTATSRTCPQFYRDQEDYVSMFSQEEDYSNIGKPLGESFRDKKYIRKYNKHNIKRKEHSESDTPDD
ncbi:uncharacterized protein LOC117104158 [Anneissia japonica]|uniref:uncharacterized protein LOC117104158 n=1 Tax=Anneissia japonica TaxID=1529436 RepID=UPI0014254E83|nr:uncharacterized protein LOC117104158 [Anneissia japonica]